MIIQNSKCVVYDIEVFVNCFHCTLYDTETKELLKFEVSKYKNEMQNMLEYFLNTDAYFVGYNNHHYDDPIINYCIEFFNNGKHGWRSVCESVFNLSRTITTTDNNELWKRWKYAKNFKTLDLLTMLYSSALRVSLKQMQVTMHYENVQEFECDWEKPIQDENRDAIDSMIEYNINDVMSTTKLLESCKNDIDLRLEIQNEYDIKCLSKDGVSIGVELLKQKYLQATGLTWWDIKDLRSPADTIALKDVILPIIEFKSPILKSLLKEMKDLTVSPGRKGWNKKFLFHDRVISIGVGGIHSINEPELITPNEDEELVDADFASLYPSLIISWGFVPPHLGKDFLSVYKKVLDERIEAKHSGNTLKNLTLKLLLNSVTGNYQNEHSWLYSPYAVMQIRMNGQLLLLMLAERLIEIGCKIIQYNTDGIFMIRPKSKVSEYDAIVAEFEQLSRLQLETDKFEGMYQMAINDYFAVSDGFTDTVKQFENGESPINKKTKKPFTSYEEIRKAFVKEKGVFITDVVQGKGLKPKVIPKAVQYHILKGTKVKDYIESHSDIKDFLMSEKTGKQWTVYHGDKKVQQTNRFYASTNGYYLFKEKESKEGTTTNNMLTASGVTILNKFDDKPIEDRKINYRYYVTEAQKIVNKLTQRQLSLF